MVGYSWSCSLLRMSTVPNYSGFTKHLRENSQRWWTAKTFCSSKIMQGRAVRVTREKIQTFLFKNLLEVELHQKLLRNGR